MPLMSMIKEAMSPSVDETYCDLMHRMEANEDRMFFHTMGEEQEYVNKQPRVEKVAAKELLERLEKHEDVRDEVTGTQEAYANPETAKWDAYFDALEAEIDTDPSLPENKPSDLGGETVELETDGNMSDQDKPPLEEPNEDPLDAVSTLGVVEDGIVTEAFNPVTHFKNIMANFKTNRQRLADIKSTVKNMNDQALITQYIAAMTANKHQIINDAPGLKIAMTDTEREAQNLAKDGSGRIRYSYKRVNGVSICVEYVDKNDKYVDYMAVAGHMSGFMYMEVDNKGRHVLKYTTYANACKIVANYNAKLKA